MTIAVVWDAPSESYSLERDRVSAGPEPHVMTAVFTFEHSGALKESQVARAVLQELTRSGRDFTKVSTLANRLGVTERVVHIALAELGSSVRRPEPALGNYPELYRAASRGRTWRERWAHARSVLIKEQD